IFIYVSIVFLLVYLFRLDYLSFSKIRFNYTYLIFSVILLWLGFFVSMLSWWNILRMYNIKVKPLFAVYSHGISVFAKYIPGKIWVILGRAYKVSTKNFSLKFVSALSLKEQLIYLLLGLLVSFPAVLIYDKFSYYSLLVFVSIIGLSVLLFSKIFHAFVVNIFERVFKKKIHIPLLEFNKSLRVSGLILVYWGIWIFAFYFFVRAILPEVSFISAFAFPISVSYGVLAIIMPGGIGVREGIMVLFLTSVGVNIEIAITISVASRLWYISGEIFSFVLALILKCNKKLFI
ncbi:MAG: lysylphosphatidylglycerol synthase domain-containing protein, partial [Bacteroidales bacterium]|nr:lysylphosphatidylglycerol synthase domain-containing protein [Bacteroidales bacterium]